MKRTKVVSISIPEELILAVENMVANKNNKFYSKSHAYAYLLNIGINEFRSGERLVSFIDSILGKTEENKNGKPNTKHKSATANNR